VAPGDRAHEVSGERWKEDRAMMKLVGDETVKAFTAICWLGVSFASWVAPDVAWAQERTYEWGWGMHPMSWMWGAWGIAMMVMMLVFWGLVIAGIVLAIRWLIGQSGRSRSDRALDILRERYARGEINKDEFEAKQRDLR
jgi:putative membrane protein